MEPTSPQRKKREKIGNLKEYNKKINGGTAMVTNKSFLGLSFQITHLLLQVGQLSSLSDQ